MIAILAAITAIAFNGIQKRGRDAQRVSDMTTIIKGLELYKAQHGDWPASTTAHADAWDSSADFRGGHVFMVNLKNSGIMNNIPADPVNTSFNNAQTDGMHYNYFRYDIPSYMNSIGCPTDRGSLAVLMVTDMESVDGPHPDSPGFSCSGRDWQNEGDWVWGAYSKG